MADASVKAKSDVLATYKAYVDFEVITFASGHADAQKQVLVSNGEAYSRIATALLKYQQSGIVFQGQPTTSPQVTAVDLQGSPHKATLTDCFDGTNWKPVYSATGASAAVAGQPLRYTVNVSAEQVPDGTWRISQYSPDKAHTC